MDKPFLDWYLVVLYFWRCLKITEKVSFNIASGASYGYILSGQKVIKRAETGQFAEFLKTWSLRSNSVTRQISFDKTKIGGKCQNSKIHMRHFEQFLNNVYWSDWAQIRYFF